MSMSDTPGLLQVPSCGVTVGLAIATGPLVLDNHTICLCEISSLKMWFADIIGLCPNRPRSDCHIEEVATQLSVLA